MQNLCPYLFLTVGSRFDGRCLFTVEDTFWRWFQALVVAADPRFGVVRGGRRWIFSVSGDRRRRPEVQGVFHKIDGLQNHFNKVQDFFTKFTEYGTITKSLGFFL